MLVQFVDLLNLQEKEHLVYALVDTPMLMDKINVNLY
jgi:hypothetical protein